MIIFLRLALTYLSSLSFETGSANKLERTQSEMEIACTSKILKIIVGISRRIMTCNKFAIYNITHFRFLHFNDSNRTVSLIVPNETNYQKTFKVKFLFN